MSQMRKTQNCGNLTGPVGGECTGDRKWSVNLFIFYCSLTFFFPGSFSGFPGSWPAALWDGRQTHICRVA